MRVHHLQHLELDGEIVTIGAAADPAWLLKVAGELFDAPAYQGRLWIETGSEPAYVETRHGAWWKRLGLAADNAGKER